MEFDERVSDWEDSDDDDFMLATLDMRKRPKNEGYLEVTVPQMSEIEFMEHFRVSRRVVDDLVARYEGSTYCTYQAGPNGKIDSRSRDVADRFNISIGMLQTIIETTTVFLSNLSPTVIKWPTEEEKVESEREFARRGFPGAIGAVDGTHVRIDKPSDDPESYFNRKDFYSVQAQVVCDGKRRIIDAYVGLPGSVHDARAYRMSSLSDTIEEKCGEYFILGDSAYPCLYHLITPYKDRGNLSGRHKRFNTLLSKGRILIEHTFGIVKQKFRQLYHLKLRNPEIINHFIRACFVLHNLALDDHFHETDASLDPPTSNLADDGSRRDIALEEEDTRTGQNRRERLLLSHT